MQSQAQQILERCQQVIAKAKELYGLDMSKVQIRFDLRGRAAGQAQMRGTHFAVRFNRDMLTREAFDHVLNNTVPHEFAHIACFMNPNLGRNHNSGWEKICRALGGSGATRHQEDVVMGKGTTYEYITTNGNTVRIGDRHHRKVQAGTTLTFRKGKGAINQFCTYSIVGVNGRTLANPIVKQAPNHPDAIEMARRMAMVEELRVRQVTQQAAPSARPVTPAAPLVNRVQPTQMGGESKAAISRRIMLSGFNSGKSYEEIIAAMQAANGYDRQLARGTFKANAPKVGIPESFYA